MNNDIVSITGERHRICEDYARCNAPLRESALHNPDKHGLPYVIVADGCSGAVDSDFGARLLAKSAETFLGEEFFHVKVIAAASSMAKGLGLPESALDATLLTGKFIVDGDWSGVMATVYGDGVVAAKRRNGNLVIRSYDYAPAADGRVYPNYLSYSISKTRMALRAEHGIKDQLNLKQLELKADGDQIAPLVSSVIDGPFACHGFSSKDYEFVVFMTDGVQSYYCLDENGTKIAVSHFDVVQKIMEFKGSKNGDFVKRAMNGLMKEAAKNNWHHYDDVTIGAIYLGD